MTAQDQDTFLQVGEYRVLLVPSRGERMFYAFARTLVDGINHLYFGVKVEGREKIPSPPYILAPTHRSNIDTLLMGSVVRRRLRFMGKDGLWRRRFFGKVLGALGGIPVNRETADRGAVALDHGDRRAAERPGPRRHLVRRQPTRGRATGPQEADAVGSSHDPRRLRRG